MARARFGTDLGKAGLFGAAGRYRHHPDLVRCAVSIEGRRYSIGDYVFTLFGFIGLAIPDFLLALILMYWSFATFGHTMAIFSQLTW